MGYCLMCSTKLVKKKGEDYCPNCQISVEDYMDALRYDNIWGSGEYLEDDEEEDED